MLGLAKLNLHNIIELSHTFSTHFEYADARWHSLWTLTSASTVRLTFACLFFFLLQNISITIGRIATKFSKQQSETVAYSRILLIMHSFITKCLLKLDPVCMKSRKKKTSVSLDVHYHNRQQLSVITSLS